MSGGVDFASCAFKRKLNGKPLSERQFIAMQAERVAAAHRRLKDEFLSRQASRVSSATGCVR